jgi:3-oxosteroid 1-dehydrogenase
VPVVNSTGVRFVNEAAPYVDAVHAMYDTGSVPAWMVFDQRYRNSYLFAGMGHASRCPAAGTSPVRWCAPQPSPRWRSDRRAAKALQSTVDRLNGFAASGVDEDFHKGDSAYDKYYGDPRNKPNPCLAPLAKPPFYAIKVVPGDLGTKGGLRTTSRRGYFARTARRSPAFTRPATRARP